MINTKFGERLSELMLTENLTNKALGDKIGVAESTISCWKRGKLGIKLSKAIAIVEYFNCSLEFLIGRSEKQLDFTPHQSTPFFENLQRIMAMQKIKRSKVEKELKLSHKNFKTWKEGADPYLENVIDLVNYFNITLDYFVGRER